jgi:hypothetical protein
VNKKRVRISISQDVWDAVLAISKARRVGEGEYIEEALTSYMSPLRMVEGAVQAQARFIEVSEMIEVLADFVVDHRRILISDGVDAE